MSTSLRTCFAVVVLAVLVGGPLWYSSYHHRTYRNFRAVEEGVLYRSGQMTVAGLERVLHDYGIKTIISLRDGEKELDQAEEAFAHNKSVKFVRLPHKGWWGPKDTVPNAENLTKFRAVMADRANYPVLIHCFAGIHRTGAYCAIWRMEQGWSNESAIREMCNLGYDILEQHQDLKHFLLCYRPQAASASPDGVFRAVSQQK